uniref:Uncharacterized protein n=1 Tax=Amphimedon queenslandica TaxID=400682 RepID=A0A1X7U839_AMPQE
MLRPAAANDGYCVNSTNSINASFIKEKALEVQRSLPLHRRSQFIYPWIVFSCNGSVTKWIFGANNNGNLSQPELQIWRQLGPNNYNKTGSSLINADTMIGTNLYEFIPQTPLQFQEGDIFGVYSYKIDGERLVLYEQRESGPTNLRINSNLNSPPLKITEVLATTNNDFPLITVEISVSTESVLVITSSVENSPVISSTSVSYELFSSHYVQLSSTMSSLSPTRSFDSPSSHSQTFNIVSQSTIAIGSSRVLVNLSETLTPTSTQTNNAITSSTSTASTSGSDSVSFTTTKDDTLLSTSSSNVIGSASNTSGSMTIIIGAVSLLLLVVAIGLVVSLLVVITACRIKRKKSRGIDSVSQDRDSGLNNPTYGDNHYVNTKHGLCINSKEQSYSYEIANDVYGEQELVGSLNPLLPTNDGISNTLMTLEINEVLYGNNETEELYSEAVAAPTSALGTYTTTTNESSAYHTLQRELFVPKA